MISVTMNLTLRALHLMTQEHETEIRDFFVRKKINSYDIIFVNMSFCFVMCLFQVFLIKKKVQAVVLFLFLWMQTYELK